MELIPFFVGKFIGARGDPVISPIEEASPEVLQVAVKAAREAGAHLLSYRHRLRAEQIEEKSANDFVTAVDRESEQIITGIIHDTYPDHQILAEESGQKTSRSPYRWIIDPIDGTTNYIRGIPFFCVSIGVTFEDQLYAGAVYNPRLEEMFTACAGRGAYLNDTPIEVSAATSLSRALLTTGFPHHAKSFLPQFMTAFNDIYFKSAGVRRPGSAALDLCYTAAGRFDAFFELGLHPWDIAAGGLILQEAGGTVSDFHGGDRFMDSGFLIGAPPAIHQQLQSILTVYFEETIYE